MTTFLLVFDLKSTKGFFLLFLKDNKIKSSKKWRVDVEHCSFHLNITRFSIDLPNILIDEALRSSLFYNTSARHRRHECDTRDTIGIRVRHEWQDRDTSTTRKTRMWHEWKILILISTSKTYFQTSILALWQMKDCKDKKNVILDVLWKNYVGFLKSVVLQLFPKYSQSFTNLNVKSRPKSNSPWSINGLF